MEDMGNKKGGRRKHKVIKMQDKVPREGKKKEGKGREGEGEKKER